MQNGWIKNKVVENVLNLPAFINLSELFDTKYVIPTEGNFWTSSDANDSQAYTMHIDSQYGARFEKNDKKNAYRVFPFVIMRELK